MAIKTDGSAPSPALRSGSLRSPPLRAGEGAEPNANSQQQKKSTKFISGLDLHNVSPLFRLPRRALGAPRYHPGIFLYP